MEDLEEGQVTKITCLRAYQIAVGKLGVDPGYFLHKMSFLQFNNLLIGYYEKYEEEHNKYRKLLYYLAKPNFKVGPFEEFEKLEQVSKAKKQKSTKERFDFVVELFNLKKGVKLSKKEYGVR